MNKVFKYLKGDRTLWIMAFVFAMISIVTVYSFIPVLSRNGGSTEYYLIKHAIILGTGFLLMYFVHKIDFKYFSKLAQVMLWISAILLLITLVYGATINNAARWLEIPVINQKFQTSDLAKLSLVMYVARMLVINRDKLDNFKEGILPILIPVLVICGLIIPQDLSTAAMLFGICMLIMFLGKVPVKQLAISLGGTLALFLFLLYAGSSMFPRVETWKSRFEAWVVGIEEPQSLEEVTESQQLEHAQRAIHNGGLWGKGPGKGEYKRILYAAHADSYFAAFVEEFGLIGGCALIIFFLVFLFRSIRIAIKSEKQFGMYVVIGISLALVCQAFVNMAVPTGIVPVTGQNMPMLGLGGTSIWFTCLAIGVILSVSRSVIKESSSNAISSEDSAESVNPQKNESHAAA